MERWEKTKQVNIHTACINFFKHNKEKREWMIEKILIMVEKREKYKNRNQVKYRESHNRIRTKIRTIKEE